MKIDVLIHSRTGLGYNEGTTKHFLFYLKSMGYHRPLLSKANFMLLGVH